MVKEGYTKRFSWVCYCQNDNDWWILVCSKKYQGVTGFVGPGSKPVPSQMKK